jgi:hypothetical protein
MNVRPSVRMKHLCFHWKNFHENLYLSVFRKSVEKIQVSLKSDKNKQKKTNIHLWSYLLQIFLEWEMFQTNWSRKQISTSALSKCTRRPPAENENTRGCIHVKLMTLTSWGWADDARNV